MRKVIQNLNPSQATTYKKFQLKHFKQRIDVCINKLTELVYITPVHKKNETTSMTNSHMSVFCLLYQKFFKKSI